MAEAICRLDSEAAKFFSGAFIGGAAAAAAE
jgi:hypothetical protein